MKQGLLVFWLFITIVVSGNATELKRGDWNLISVCQDINRSDINMSGIDEIQNQDGLSIYTGSNAEFTNLHTLEAGYGYWVKGEVGTNFNGGEAFRKLVKPLRRESWNLMASCEDISSIDINMTEIFEIQSQNGRTIYTGTNAKYSNLESLENGYGYWVKGDVNGSFVSKYALTLPLGFDYQLINNEGEVQEPVLSNYTVKLYSDFQNTLDSQLSHVGVVVSLNGNEVPIMQIQENYRDHEVLVGVYDNRGTLVAVSDRVVVDSTSSVQFISLLLSGLHSTPTALDDSVTVDSDKNITIDVLANDIDIDLDDTKSLVTVGLPAFGTATIVNDRILYTPTSNSNGVDSFSYTMQDSSGLESNATVSVMIVDKTSPSIPSLISTPPIETSDKNVTVELSGEVGSMVYVNGVEVATVGADGRVTIILDTRSREDSSFEIRLQDSFGNESEAISFTIIKYNLVVTTTRAELKGNLSNADVKIYRVEENGDKTLLFKETTDENGEFPDHKDALENDRIYIYEVSGGVDTNNSLDNNGTIRAVVKGSWVNSSDSGVSVSLASEMAYVFVAKDLKYDFNATMVENKLQEVATNMITLDINGDKKIDVMDLIGFSYQNNLSTLNSSKYSTATIAGMLLDIYANDKAYTESILDSGVSRYSAYAHDMILSEDTSKIYLTDHNFRILDVSNIKNINSIGYYNPHLGHALNSAVSKDESKLFLLTTWMGDDELEIVDISNPSSMTRISLLELGSMDVYGDLALSPDETRLYVTNKVGFNIIDIFDLENPQLIKTIPGRVKGLSISKDGTKAFVSANSNGLKVIDLLSLEVVETFALGGDVRDVQLSKDESKLFVANWSKGLQVLDVSDIENISVISEYYIGSSTGTLTVSKDEKTIYLSGDSSRSSNTPVVQVDISNLLSPKDKTVIYTNRTNTGVGLSDDGSMAYIVSAGSPSELVVVYTKKMFEQISNRVEIEVTSKTNQNSLIAKVKAPVGSEIVVNGTATGVVVPSFHEANITLDTSGADGNKTFTISFINIAGVQSDGVSVSILKDTVSPEEPTLSEVAPLKTFHDSVSLEINGEVGSRVYVNGVIVATIGTSANSMVTLTLNNGENQFDITLQDGAGNESEAISFVIIKPEQLVVSNTSELREALEIASSNGKNDTIVLEEGIYKTTDDGEGTFTFNSSEDYNLTIKSADGLSRDDVVLDGDNSDRVFYYSNNKSNTQVSFKKLSVMNGNIPYTGSYTGWKESSGSAILVYYGNSSFDDVNVSNNNTFEANSGNAEGGALTTYNGTMIVKNAIISNNYAGENNSANGAGGGLSLYQGIMVVSNSLIENNRARYGGGIYGGSQSRIVILNTTVKANSANQGGGLYPRGLCIVDSSTISSNTYNGYYQYQGNAILYNSQLIDNQASSSTYEENLTITDGVILDRNKNEINLQFTNLFTQEEYFQIKPYLSQGFLDSFDVNDTVEKLDLTYTSHTYPSSSSLTHTNDFDSDGDIDIAYATSSTVGVFINDGAANFTKFEAATGVSRISDVFSSDLDNDGDMDIVTVSETTSSSGDGYTRWYENDGQFNFTKHEIYNFSAEGINSVFVKDVDGNGYTDILVAGPWNSNLVGLLKNNGDKTFTYTKVGSGSDMFGVGADDFDGDSIIDVLAYSRSNVYWFRNDGTENFSGKLVYQSSGSDNGGGAYSEDIDNDGDKDIIVANYTDDFFSWHENDGQGNFTTRILTKFKSESRPKDVYADDIDQDGDMDIVGVSGNFVEIFVNDSINSKFKHYKLNYSAPDTSNWDVPSIHTADLDGDGIQEIVAGSRWFKLDTIGN